MTEGEQVVAVARQKTSFYDAHEKRVYLKFIDIARRIVDEPTTVTAARDYLSKFRTNYQSDSDSLRHWQVLLQQPPISIAQALLEDTPQGRRLRDTAPVFAAISRDEAVELWSRSA